MDKVITMTLSGPTADVMEIVGLAVAANVLSGFQVREPASNGAAQSTDDDPYGEDGPRDCREAVLHVGDRVTQTGSSSFLDLMKDTKGQHGRVSHIARSGKGFAIQVKWDSGDEGYAYGRLLRRHNGGGTR